MITFKPGDIILIPFPFTDFSTFKQRPAVVISSGKFNATHSDVIAIAITSNVPGIIPEDEYLLSRDEIRQANLPKPSIIKVSKIITINKILIRKKLGNLPPLTIEKIKTILQNIL